MRLNLNKIIQKRKTGDAATVGLWGGIIVGGVMAVFTF
jgi:hypothetical protein